MAVPNSVSDALRALQNITSKYVGSTGSLKRKSTVNTADPTLLPLLPHFTATNITSQLQTIGLSHSRSQEASTAYLNMADKLRNECETSFRRSLQDLVSRGLSEDTDRVETEIQTWSALYTARTKRWAEAILYHARQSALQHPHGIKQDLRKPTFNYEYIPLLEKYFEYNAYPSAPDREILARKSMMTPRQIEVWFQNHRRRAKKDGKKLRRLGPDPLPLQLSLESLADSMPLFTIPENERNSLIDLSEPESLDDDLPTKMDQIQDQHTHNPLSSIAPPHAFPTPYPPPYEYDPFPTKCEKYEFPPPVWMRKAATSCPSKSPVDMEELVSEFVIKLVIREKASTKPGNSPSDTPPWFAATRTVTSAAPHPAFIRLPNTNVLPFSPIQAIAAPPSYSHPFRFPSPYSQPSTLVSSTQSNASRRRKVAVLPKRTPKNTSISHRGASPALSEVSPASSNRSLSSSSRTPSFNSNASSNRRPSSSSSSSSTSSSTLTTPVLTSMALPDSASSPPVSISGVDFQGVDDLFGDSIEATSPLDEFPAITTFSNPTIQGKERFRFGLEPTCPGPGYSR